LRTEHLAKRLKKSCFYRLIRTSLHKEISMLA